MKTYFPNLSRTVTESISTADLRTKPPAAKSILKAVQLTESQAKIILKNQKKRQKISKTYVNHMMNIWKLKLKLVFVLLKVVVITVVVGVDLLKLQNILINSYEINYVSMLIFLIFNVIVSGLINI